MRYINSPLDNFAFPLNLILQIDAGGKCNTHPLDEIKFETCKDKSG